MEYWKKITIVVVIIIILLSVSTASAIYYEETRYNHLHSDHTSLQSTYNQKVDDYNILQSEHNSLEVNHNSLEIDHSNLQSTYNQKVAEYNFLQSQYDELEVGYYALDEDYEFYKNSIEFRFGDGSDCQLFITPDDSSVISTTRNILGHYSDGDLSWDDMKEINNWVGGNIDYNYDTYIGQRSNCYQYPSETIDLGRGDCEDHAVLMVSMCNVEEEVSWLYCTTVRYYRDGEYRYHQIVFVNVADDELYIFDPTTKPAWFGFGDVWHSSSSKSEYDALIEYKNKAGASSNIEVLTIFNKYMYRSFNSNQEFYDFF